MTAKEFFKNPIVLGVLAVLLILLFIWLFKKFFSGTPSKPTEEEGEVQKSCNQEYQDAENEWKKSGQSCILTSETVVCPRDNNFTAEVNPCVAAILKDKGWKNVEIEIPNGSSNATTDNLEVINPSGASMYYQYATAGGYAYSKSNIVLPVGTKLELIKTWQTNVSTQPFGGYYETKYKQYGPTSGFFRTEDIKK